MTNISLNISKKINPDHLDTIIEIKQITDSLEIPFFIIGASARDYLLE